MMQQCTRGTKYSISGHAPRWSEQIWCILEVLYFSPLTYNGEVTKLTWHKVTDIKNPKYTNCRHLCSYWTLRVSKSSDHWCAFGTMSNFEKRNLRSGHLLRPGHVTFGVIGSSFFRNVSNCWLNSYGKFGGAKCKAFDNLNVTWIGRGLQFSGRYVTCYGSKLMSGPDRSKVSFFQFAKIPEQPHGVRYTYWL